MAERGPLDAQPFGRLRKAPLFRNDYERRQHVQVVELHWCMVLTSPCEFDPLPTCAPGCYADEHEEAHARQQRVTGIGDRVWLHGADGGYGAAADRQQAIALIHAAVDRV